MTRNAFIIAIAAAVKSFSQNGEATRPFQRNDANHRRQYSTGGQSATQGAHILERRKTVPGGGCIRLSISARGPVILGGAGLGRVVSVVAPTATNHRSNALMLVKVHMASIINRMHVLEFGHCTLAVADRLAKSIAIEGLKS